MSTPTSHGETSPPGRCGLSTRAARRPVLASARPDAPSTPRSLAASAPQTRAAPSPAASIPSSLPSPPPCETPTPFHKQGECEERPTTEPPPRSGLVQHAIEQI